MVEDYSRACQRERGKKREEEEKSPEKKHFAVTGIWTHGLCHQSRASYIGTTLISVSSFSRSSVKKALAWEVAYSWRHHHKWFQLFHPLLKLLKPFLTLQSDRGHKDTFLFIASVRIDSIMIRSFTMINDYLDSFCWDRLMDLNWKDTCFRDTNI